MKTGQEVMDELEGFIMERMEGDQWPDPLIVSQAMMNIIVMFSRTKPERRTEGEEAAELDELINRAYEITEEAFTPNLKIV